MSYFYSIHGVALNNIIAAYRGTEEKHTLKKIPNGPLNFPLINFTTVRHV